VVGGKYAVGWFDIQVMWYNPVMRANLKDWVYRMQYERRENFETIGVLTIS